MNSRKPEILYSDPVKEIMGNPPRRILRWGTGVMVAVFVLFILFAWLIRYPDTIPAPVEITTSNPPVTLVTKITGNIKYIYVKEKENVSAGQLLAVMETTASIDQIKLLKQTVDTIRTPEIMISKSLPGFSQLGELQEVYGLFLKNLSDLNNYITNDFYGNKIASLTAEIRGIQEYINRLVVKEKLFSENQKLEYRKFRRDSLLFVSKVIPESELERSHQLLIRQDIELQQVRLDHSQKSIEMSEKRQLLQDYNIKKIEEKEKLVSVLNESFMNLNARLKIWENTYTLISPVAGTVSFTRFWNANQSVVKDEPVMTVVPLETGNYLGRINLKMQRSGKVKPGQKVNIKLSGYPYLEYGMVRGIIKSISLVPSLDSYIIEIDLPDGLTTLYGLKLDFTQNMQGTAEIITEDIRLLQKIINPFRYMISRNKSYAALKE
ncbi:MAG: HlyD family efflux transporter periplasmic adaptor subunit [Bacteroidales bacterium]|nr:HlyD family efflux transporter periplasmic adaptor subunit [Bacteroidales bacterium]